MKCIETVTDPETGNKRRCQHDASKGIVYCGVHRPAYVRRKATVKAKKRDRDDDYRLLRSRALWLIRAIARGRYKKPQHAAARFLEDPTSYTPDRRDMQ